ncbi:phenylalanine--tRNA ligase beta subunit-related protein [Sanguibacter sp. 25GB23B1]|uniref:B3/B4 domain-containing protein n=1 Tax=unclassified Sanguibacter TaxID=2645534 RepID=UPI0032B01F8D
MTDSPLDAFLADAHLAPEVFALRPDYRAMLVAVDGITPGPSDATSDALLRAAEESATRALAESAVTDLPHIAAWRDAYTAFGAKPGRTRNSLEALVRRATGGLPRVNRLTDVYNAISVAHQIPLGGEDLAAYDGAPHLVRATGTEHFDTTADGEDVVDRPEPGEVVWRDATGVTCRRWNWRQGRRTRLREDTTSALFILDALEPLGDDELVSIADELAGHLVGLGPHVTHARRTLSATDPG